MTIRDDMEVGTRRQMAQEPGSDDPGALDTEHGVPGMFDGPLLPLLLQLAGPVVAGFLIQILYSITDMIWISMIDLSDATLIAGVGIVFPLGMILFAIANGFQVAMGAVLSRAIGAKDQWVKREIFAVAMTQTIIVGSVMLVLGSIYGDALLSMLGATGTLAVSAKSFFYYSLPGIVPVVLSGALMGLLQGQGRIQALMQAVLLGSLSNIVLDPLLIFTLGLGVKGAAIGTCIAQYLTMASLLVTLLSSPNGLNIRFIPSHGTAALFKRLSATGSAQMWMQIIISGSILVYNRFVIDVDPLAMTAFTLCGRIDFVVMIPMFAISTALLTVAGQNWGREQHDRALAALRIASYLSVGTVLVLAIAHILIAPLIYPLLSTVPEVSYYAVLQTRIMELSLPVIAISLCASEFYQAIGYPGRALLLTLVRHVLVSIPLVMILVHQFDLGILGVYFGAMSGTAVAAVVAVLILRQTEMAIRARHTPQAAGAIR